MKQRLLILAAATAVAFAACNGGNNEGSYTQAQLDSIAKVKTDSLAAVLKAQNDSTIAAQAQATSDSLRVADSLANATKGASATNIKKNSGSKTPVKPPKKDEPKKEEPKKEVTNEDRKAARFGDKDAKQKVEEDNTNKKGDRFKNR